MSQLVSACAEQVQFLAARHLGVEAVFLGDLPNDDEFFGRDFTTGNTWNDRIEALSLNIRRNRSFVS